LAVIELIPIRKKFQENQGILEINLLE